MPDGVRCGYCKRVYSAMGGYHNCKEKKAARELKEDGCQFNQAAESALLNDDNNPRVPMMLTQRELELIELATTHYRAGMQEFLDITKLSDMYKDSQDSLEDICKRANTLRMEIIRNGYQTKTKC